MRLSHQIPPPDPPGWFNQSGELVTSVYLRCESTGQATYANLERINDDELYGKYRAVLVSPQNAAPGRCNLACAEGFYDRQGNNDLNATPPQDLPTLIVNSTAIPPS